MRRMIVAAAVMLATAAVVSTRAEAFGPGGAAGLSGGADAIAVTESVQYVIGGRRHCWYPTGWHGPGWYWCGYAARAGLGWGGPAGWNGWRAGGPVVVAPRVRGPVVVAPARRRGVVIVR